MYLQLDIPIAKAKVETISKYSNAFPPIRPTFFISPMPPIPITTVKKMIGAITILINLINHSARTLSCEPKSGKK